MCEQRKLMGVCVSASETHLRLFLTSIQQFIPLCECKKTSFADDDNLPLHISIKPGPLCHKHAGKNETPSVFDACLGSCLALLGQMIYLAHEPNYTGVTCFIFM